MRPKPLDITLATTIPKQRRAVRPIPPIPDFSALDIAELRQRLHMSQNQFAARFGFPVATLRHWERGNRQPSGAALTLLHIIAENAPVALRAIIKVRARARFGSR